MRDQVNKFVRESIARSVDSAEFRGFVLQEYLEHNTPPAGAEAGDVEAVVNRAVNDVVRDVNGEKEQQMSGTDPQGIAVFRTSIPRCDIRLIGKWCGIPQ